jgi:hypothetical protein
MVRRLNPIFALTVLFIASLSTTSLLAQSLKTIDPPGGGKIMYGQVAGQTTEAGAMAYILHNLHQNLGDKPQVGKLFQVRNTQSVATFFSVTRHDQGQGKPAHHIAGLLIATKVSTDHVEAALVSDDAARFPKTLQPMMKMLFASWHPLQGGSQSGAVGSSAPAAPLHKVVLQDNSAMVSLPAGWQLAPQMSAMGTIVASGPEGDSAELGVAFLAFDTNNPQTQQLLRTLRQGGLRNTSYATASYVPYGGDLAKTYTYLMGELRKKANLAPATYNFSSATPAQSGGRTRCVHLVGTVDLGDNKGPREFNGLYCQDPPGQGGSFLSTAYTTIAPMQIAAKERATLAAILSSFQVNQQVVSQQAAAIAAPAIEQIHAIGRAAAEQARSSHEAFEIHNSSVYSRWDSQDKRSQEFENYQLGYSVISTTDNSAHGTFWNEDADALVKSNPDKFEYVNAPNYWKGIDY